MTGVMIHDANGYTEYWADDPDDENGTAWRVAMRNPPDPEAQADHAYDEARDWELTER